MRRLRLRLGMIVVVLMCIASTARAQASLDGMHVLLIQKDSFSRRNIDAVIRLFSDSTPPIIALRRSAAGPDLLYTALTALAAARTRHPTGDAKHFDVVVRSGIQYPPISSDRWAWASKLVGRLQGAGQVALAGVGRVQGVTIVLDAHAPGSGG